MSQDEHTLKRFDNELESIRANILHMGGLVEMQFLNAIQEFFKLNPYLARQTIDQDQQVNRLEVEIDTLCCNAIALYKPIPSDLRLIITSIKIRLFF